MYGSFSQGGQYHLNKINFGFYSDELEIELLDNSHIKVESKFINNMTNIEKNMQNGNKKMGTQYPTINKLNGLTR